VDASSDRFPVDAHVFGDGTPGEIYRKPPDCEVKVLCKAASGISPWDIRNEDTVNRTFNAVGIIGNLNKGSSPVRGSPYTGLWIPLIVSRATLVAYRAVIFMPFVWTGMNKDVFHTILIRVAINIFYHCVLDIEQFFA